MNLWLDKLLVGLALLASIGYALAALGPRALRQRLFTALVGRWGGILQSVGLLNLTRRLAKSGAKAAGTCGGCDHCGSDSAPQRAAQPAVGDVRIPVAKIGRRS